MSTFIRAVALASLAATATALAPAAAYAGASTAGTTDLAAGTYYGQGVQTPGSTIDATVGLQNLGDTASGVRITASLPRGIEFRSGAGATAAFSYDCSASTASTVDCRLVGDLPHLADPYKQAFLQLSLGVTRKATAGTAVLSFTARSTTADSNPGNDVTSFRVPVATTYGTVSGRVWDDRNHNGIQDRGEPGLPGHAVSVVEMPPVDQSAVTREAVTDKNGRYTFTHMPAYQYVVNVDNGDLRLTSPTMGNHKTRDSDFDPAKAYFNWAQSAEFSVQTKNRTVLDAGLVAQQ